MRHRVEPSFCAGAVLLLAILLAPATGMAQDRDLQPLLDRLGRLERDIRTLNIQAARGSLGSGGSAPTAGSAAVPMVAEEGGSGGLMVRMNTLEEDLRSTTGQTETLSHRIDQLSQRLEKLTTDLEFRLNALQSAVKSAAAPQATAGPAALQPTDGLPPPPSKPGALGTLTDKGGETAAAPVPDAEASEAPLPDAPPAEQYAYAFGLLRQHQYDRAATALRAFIDAHPKDGLVSNARYWLGETYYVRNDYASAAQVFAEGYQKDKQGSKAPDTLLKLGMALIKLEKKNDACLTFGELLKQFPNATPAIKKTVAREREGAGCK